MTSVARTPPLSGLALAPPGQAPVRRLTWATLITSLGNGAWYTCWALFLTRSVGLSPARVGRERLDGWGLGAPEGPGERGAYLAGCGRDHLAQLLLEVGQS